MRLGERPLRRVVADRSPPAYQADRRWRSRPGKAGLRRDDANEAHRHRGDRARRRRHCSIHLNRQISREPRPNDRKGAILVRDLALKLERLSPSLGNWPRAHRPVLGDRIRHADPPTYPRMVKVVNVINFAGEAVQYSKPSAP